MALSGTLGAVAPADGTFSTTGATNWNALTGLAVTLAGVATAAQGGTNSAFFQVAGPSVARTYTFPDADTSIGGAPSFPVTVAGTVISGGIPYFNSTTQESSSALLAQYGVVVGGGAGAAPATSSGLTFGGAAAGTGLAIAAGTATTAVSPLSITQTRNAGAVTFPGVVWTFTDTSLQAASKVFEILGGASGITSLFSITTGGTVTSALSIRGAGVYGSPGGTGLAFDGGTFFYGSSGVASWGSSQFGQDTNLSRGGANQFVFGASATAGGGTATSRAEINKNVSAIANNTATATVTGTIPNGNHSAGGKIVFKGAAGAGGAIGADEFTALVEYDWIVTRTTGANAVATLSAALLTAITASVVSGATPTISAALSAISGGVSAVNTFTFNVTINALTGSSTNHTCFTYLTGLNDNSSGVTFA